MVIKVQKRKKKKRKKNLKKGDSFGAFATSSLLSDTYVRIFFTHHYHHPLHLHLHLHIFTFTTTLLFLSLSLSLCWTNTSLQQRSPNFGSPLLNLSLTLFQTKSLFYFNIVQIIHIYYPIPFVEASCICFGKLNHKALCGKNSVYEATGLKKKKKTKWK